MLLLLHGWVVLRTLIPTTVHTHSFCELWPSDQHNRWSYCESLKVRAGQIIIIIGPAWNVISKAAYMRMFTNYLLNCSGVCSLAVACVCEAAAVLFWESVEGHHDQNRKTGSKGGELWCLKLFSCWSWVMRFFSAQSSKTIGCNILKKCTEVLSGHALLIFFFSFSINRRGEAN